LPPGHWVYVAPNWYIWGGLAAQQPQPNPNPNQDPNQVKASVNGKYANLLKVIDVPGDAQQYGDFNDYGFWTGTAWAGHANLPQGYWVYVAPKWYIWGKQQAVQAPPQPAPVPAPAPAPVPANLQKASVNGKYMNLLRVINVPQDKAQYGDFSDYGHYTGTSWAGFDNLPVGYWVYVAPDWYIWEKETPKGPAAPPAPGPNPNAPDEVKASVNGKYSKLLRVINVPADEADYGKFSDYGLYSGTEWAGYDHLPPGHWVYVYPNWYIWEEKNK
jgi:hypothetical protein